MSCVIPKCSSPYHMSVYDRDSGRTVDVCIDHASRVSKFGSSRVADFETGLIPDPGSAVLSKEAVLVHNASHRGEEFATTYRYIGDGKQYGLVGTSKGAGTSRGESIVVYQCTESGQLFHRTVEDFNDRMVPVEG